MIKLKVQVPIGATLSYTKNELRQAMRGAGQIVAKRARALIRMGTTGRNRRTSSAPGDPPVSRTGTLARLIKVRPFRNGEGVSIRDTAFYALFLEAGAHGGGGDTRQQNLRRAFETDARGRLLRAHARMKASAVSKTRELKPRPFLSRALHESEAEVSQRIVRSVLRDVTFNPGKVKR